MKILIVGAGAVGQYLGGMLSLGGNEVTLICRRKYCDSITEKGLNIYDAKKKTEKKSKNIKVHEGLDLVPSIDKGNFDLVIITVKSYDLKTSLGELRDYPVFEYIPIIIMQNGIGNEEKALAFGFKKLISGALTIPVEINNKGQVVAASSGGLGLAPCTSMIDDLGFYKKIFDNAQIKCQAYPDYRALKWSKLILNITANAISAILEMSPREYLSHPGILKMEMMSCKEAVKIAKMIGIKWVNLPSYPVVPFVMMLEFFPPGLSGKLLKDMISKSRGDKWPSLAQDVMKGKKKTEIDALNGYLVKHSYEAGIKSLYNEFIFRVFKEKVSYRKDPDKFYNDFMIFYETETSRK